MGQKGNQFSREMQEYLEEREGKILKKWKQLFWESFGEEAKRFFTREVDQFQNPFGYRVDESFEGLLRQIFGDFDWEQIGYHLDRLVQMRAVQETEPSKALFLFFQLKRVLREEVGEKIIKKFGAEEYLKLEDRVNAILVKAFDFYMKYRERLYQLKYEEWKRNNFLLLKKAGVAFDMLEGMPVESFDKEGKEKKYQ
ncbi:MAG: hypothetical protein GXO57_03955 [Thermodesulfobacteria bacterium]|nr:hypothetical protein [Thermodesulfobacteriota bacterium]